MRSPGEGATVCGLLSYIPHAPALGHAVSRQTPLLPPPLSRRAAAFAHVWAVLPVQPPQLPQPPQPRSSAPVSVGLVLLLLFFVKLLLLLLHADVSVRDASKTQSANFNTGHESAPPGLETDRSPEINIPQVNTCVHPDRYYNNCYYCM